MTEEQEDIETGSGLLDLTQDWREEEKQKEEPTRKINARPIAYSPNSTLYQKWQEYFASFTDRFPEKDEITIKRWNLANRIFCNIYGTPSDVRYNSSSAYKSPFFVRSENLGNLGHKEFSNWFCDDPVLERLINQQNMDRWFNDYEKKIEPGITYEVAHQINEVRDALICKIRSRKMTDQEYSFLLNCSDESFLLRLKYMAQEKENDK
jgi:hypothetical protein